jgi:hypothetical protein
MRYAVDFFAGAEGTPTAQNGDVTDNQVVEDVDASTVEEVTTEIDTVSDEETSEDPKSTTQEVESHIDTVHPKTHPTVIHHYGNYPYPYGGYPSVVVDEPTVYLEEPSADAGARAAVDYMEQKEEDRRNQTRFLVTWMVLAGLGIILYNAIGKKI